MDLAAFYNQFRDETTEQIRILNDGLLAIEQAADEVLQRSEIDRIFRAVHTIKGSARMLGFEQIGRLAHIMEDALGAIRQGRRTLDRALTDLLLRGGDSILALTANAVDQQPAPDQAVIEALIAQFDGNPAPAGAPTEPASATGIPAPPTPLEPETPQAPAMAVAPQPPSNRSGRATVRVRIDRLDRMLNLAGELTIGGQMLNDHQQQLSHIDALITEQERIQQALNDDLNRLRFSASQRQSLDRHLTTLRQTAEQARVVIDRERTRFGRYVGQHELLAKDLEQEVMAARMMPIATVYANLPRAVRDLTQATNKEMRLELQGEHTELDRKVLELLTDPLLHLVRNAIDHGIEPPNQRVAAGKPAHGTLTISAVAAGSEVRLTVQDDGRGMDPQRLRDRAVQNGMLSATQAARLSTAEAFDLIFQPGFSTAQIVTDISGRGVGMDVVRTNITDLGGNVLVESQIGQGTQITLLLPLTLVTTRVLLVQLGQSSFALPAGACQGTIWIYRDAVRVLNGQPTLEYAGRTIALLRLADLIGVEADAGRRRSERSPAILVGSGKRLNALLVDALLDEREAVVKPLGPLLASRRSFGGAVQLGDGNLVLLLNPLLLIEQSRSMPQRSRTVQPQVRRRRLLVTDDSFTTRELIRSILQSAGYQVTVAVDGADALDKLRAETYDLVVSDVEMPRVDGFQLTARIRSELGKPDLPVVLITSLASETHRRQGLEAGAQAYIVKSQFNQDSLLEVIRQLLGG
ncbi:MAG: hybrid sensor histidine kinase/response regulator [Oscillochloris sp.]|nr:hybrid sensor histidine kinase/response regulator [Oscillochloris sp.]